MSKKPSTVLGVSELAAMANSLKDESDRGTALIVAAWVDDALTDCIKSYLIQDGKAIKEMFGKMGPLGSFAGKIKIAYLLGRISAQMIKSLDVIRDIRNEFAHSRDDLKFSEQSISDRCGTLPFGSLTIAKSQKQSLKTNPFNPRKAYVATGILFASYFIDRRSSGESTPSFDGEAFQKHSLKILEAMKQQVVLKAKDAD